MSGEITEEALQARVQLVLARHQEVEGEREALAARLAGLELAYENLLERVQRYERERAEIRARLERLLASMPAVGSASP